MKVSIYPNGGPHKTNIVQDIKDYDVQIVCGNNWSPSIFRPDEEGVMRRQNKYFSEIELMALDFDEKLTIMEAEVRIKENNWQAQLYLTEHHQIEKKVGNNVKPSMDRFRVVIPLERKITSEADYKATWKAIQKIFPECDKACSDTARYYKPCTRLYSTIDGSPLKVTEAVKKTEVTFFSTPLSESNVKRPLSKKTWQFIATGEIPGEAWHQSFIRAVFEFKQQGYPLTEAESYMEKAASHHSGCLDEEDIRQLKDIYENREPQFPPWGTNEIQSSLSMDLFQEPSKDNLMRQYCEDLSRRKVSTSNQIPFISEEIDLLLRQGLNLIGGATGEGKTTTSANILAGFFKNGQGKKAIIISNEETSADIYDRISCVLLGLNFQSIRTGNGSIDEQRQIEKLTKALMDLLIVIPKGQKDLTCLEDVISIFEMAKKNPEAALVVLDYLQTVEFSKKEPNLDPVWVSKKLGSYLREYGQTATVPVIVFAQLSPSREESFSRRVQSDKTIANHAVLALEILPDFASQRTKIAVHKDRFGNLRNREFDFEFIDGRLEPLTNGPTYRGGEK